MTGAGWVTLIVIGVLAGLLATYARLRGRLMPGGWIGGVIYGLIGAWLGGVYLGDWGWMIGGYNVIGGIIGAPIISYVLEAFGVRPTSTPQH